MNELRVISGNTISDLETNVNKFLKVEYEISQAIQFMQTKFGFYAFIIYENEKNSTS